MSTIRSNKNVDSIARALVAVVNANSQVKAVLDGYVHRDISGVSDGTWDYPTSAPLASTAPTETNLATACVMANDLLGVMKAHFADDSAHLVADTVAFNVLDGYAFMDGYSAANAVPLLAALKVNLNAMKVQYNLHIAKTTCHLVADATNVVSSNNATSQGSADTLANEIQGDLNAHILNGPLTSRLKLE